MKKITVTVDGTGSVSLDSSDAGYYGEHLVTCLEITPAVTFSENCEYYKMNIDGYVSERLTPTDGKITYTLPGSALRPPSISCQLIGYKLIDSIPVMVIRSAVFTLNVAVSPVSESPEIINGSLQPLETALAECGNTVAAAEKLLEEITGAQSATRAELKNLKDSAASSASSAAGSSSAAGGSATAAAASAAEASASAASAANSASEAAASAASVNLGNYYKKSETYSKDGADKQFAERSSENSANPSSVAFAKAMWIRQDDTGGSGGAFLCDEYTESPLVLWSSKKTMETVREEQNKQFCNALKGSKSGGVVRIDDVSPANEELNVSVVRKNLIPYPYAFTTVAKKGITATANSDGSISVNGTNDGTGASTFSIQRVDLNKDIYVLSGGKVINTDKYASLIIDLYKSNKYVKSLVNVTADGTVIDNSDNLYDYGSLSVVVSSGTTVSDLTIKPQLEIGTSATDYTPYISDLSAVTVSKYGKNLVDFTTGTMYGVTLQYLPDEGCYMLNGSSTYASNQSMFDKTTDICGIKGKTFQFHFETVSGSITGLDPANKKYASLYTSESDSDGGNKTNFVNISLADPLKSVPKTASKDRLCDVRIYISPGVEFYNFKFKPQLEIGSAATKYEEPKAPEVYTTAESGSVSGVTAFETTTTLTPNKSDVFIDVEYNRDVNKAFAELQQAIISLGGNL